MIDGGFSEAERSELIGLRALLGDLTPNVLRLIVLERKHARREVEVVQCMGCSAYETDVKATHAAPGAVPFCNECAPPSVPRE